MSPFVRSFCDKAHALARGVIRFAASWDACTGGWKPNHAWTAAQKLLQARGFGAALLQGVPQFLQGVKLAGGVGQVAGFLGGGHGGDQGAGVSDAVLQLEDDSEICGRRLLPAEGQSALAVEVFLHAVDVAWDGFGFLRE